MNSRAKRAAMPLLASIIFSIFCNDAFCWTFNEATKLKGGYLICGSRDSYDTARGMVDGNDWDALNRFSSTGACGSTREGMEVYVIKGHAFHGTYEVRPKGGTRILWVDNRALRDSFTIPGEETGHQAQTFTQSRGNITKLEGMMSDKGQTLIFISQNGKPLTLKVGEDVCGGEIVKTYAPGEYDGITSTQSVDKYENRVKIRFAEEEKVFKNGDIICVKDD